MHLWEGKNDRRMFTFLCSHNLHFHLLIQGFQKGINKPHRGDVEYNKSCLKNRNFAENIFHFFHFLFLHLIFDEIFSLFKIGECSFKKLSLNILLLESFV